MSVKEGARDFLIRNMPLELHKCLKESARQCRRTMTGQILYILEQHFEEVNRSQMPKESAEEI